MLQLDGINQRVIADIKQKLIDQGHKFSGELEQSMVARTEVLSDRVVMFAEALGYIFELERGVAAADVKPLDAVQFNKLVRWAYTKAGAVTQAEAQRAAFFIQKKWQKEGKPLDTSKQFSSTGEVLRAIETVFKENGDEYFYMIDVAIFKELDEEFNRIQSGTI